MKNLILVTGSDGMVGSRFVELTPRRNFLHLPTEIEMDITDPEGIKNVISNYNFSAIVHFAAHTDVDEAEKQRGDKSDDCWLVNVEGTKNLVEAIKKKPRKIHFIHISTDMVFPGSADDPGPYPEDHPPETNPDKLTWYGYTKAEAERIVRDNLGEFATIARLIYPVRAEFDKKLDSVIRKPLKLYDEGKLYPLFTDQQISITYIDEAARLIDKVITNKVYGTFHASTPDTTTPFELASYVLEKTRGVKDVVEPTTLKEYLEKNDVSVVRYPQYGGLKVEKTADSLQFNFSPWKAVVDQLVQQGLGKAS